MSAEAEGPDGAFYIVKQGETLSEIARQALGDAQEWRQIAEESGAILDRP